MVSGADNAFGFHLVNQRGGAVVTNAEFALNVTGGSFFVGLNNGYRLSIQVFIAAAAKVAFVKNSTGIFFVQLAFGDAFNILRFFLRFQKSTISSISGSLI